MDSTPVAVERKSLDAMLVVGGQRIPIRVSIEPETDFEINAQLRTTEDDVYLLLQGPAHIIPGADGKIEVAFLDGANKRKQSLFFTLDPGKDPQKEGKKVLKIASLDLIIECDKAEFDALTPEDKKTIFPDTVNQIVKDRLNQTAMNTTDPPIKQSQQVA